MTEEDNPFDAFLTKTADTLDGIIGCREAAQSLRQIAISLREPFSLAVVGRMKAGKSTLINSLIGRVLAISDVEEATATLNWICHGTGEQMNQFVVHWKDGRSEPFPLSRVSDWTGKTPEVLARISQTYRLTFYSDDESLKRVQIVDTPGTGSAVEEHEVAREFLNPDVISESVSAGARADAIVYVVPPVGRESDMETLEIFRGGCIPNANPYNSVCVLHKWDGLETDDPWANAKAKAERLKDQIGSAVMDVIPVSGPIALAAKSAPDAFFLALMQTLAAPDIDIARVTKMDNRWDREQDRAHIRSLFSLPWASFKLIVRLLHELQPATVEAARTICLEASGLSKLNEFLNQRIFSQTTIIKQFQCLKRTQTVLVPAILKLQAQCTAWEEDSRLAAMAATTVEGHRPDLTRWLRLQEDKFRNQSRELYARILEIDSTWKHEQARLEALSMDLEVTEKMDSFPVILPEHRSLIKATCNHLASPSRRTQLGGTRLPSIQHVSELLEYYQTQANKAGRKQQRYFEHIALRLQQAWQQLEINLST
jgi:hypothetical protein